MTVFAYGVIIKFSDLVEIRSNKLKNKDLFTNAINTFLLDEAVYDYYDLTEEDIQKWHKNPNEFWECTEYKDFLFNFDKEKFDLYPVWKTEDTIGPYVFMGLIEQVMEDTSMFPISGIEEKVDSEYIKHQVAEFGINPKCARSFLQPKSQGRLYSNLE